MYHGKVTDNIADAETLGKALDTNYLQAKAEIADATMFLNERAGQAERGLAVIGFSLGAYYALDLAAADPEHIRSVVIFYGTGGGDFSNSRAAYLGHFAENDPFEPQSNVDELEAALRRAGRFHQRAADSLRIRPDLGQGWGSVPREGRVQVDTAQPFTVPGLGLDDVLQRSVNTSVGAGCTAGQLVRRQVKAGVDQMEICPAIIVQKFGSHCIRGIRHFKRSFLVPDVFVREIILRQTLRQACFLH